MERDNLINSLSWRVTKPLREFVAFVRRHKVLYLFAKGLLSLKRKGIKETAKKVKTLIQPKFPSKKIFSLSKEIFLSNSERLTQKNTVFPKQLKISIITPLYNTPKKFLKEMVKSVIAQTYDNWELCLADGSDKEHKNVERISKIYAKKDKRIKYQKLDKNLGISENSNKAIEMSSGEYLGLLDHDDILHPSVLYEVMKVISNHVADFVYTDEATFTNNHKITLRHHKPDYAIDTLRSCNYICHFSVFSRKLIDQVGMFRSDFDGSQDYDLILRYTDIASKIIHIPKLLYFWRSHGNSVASDVNNKSYTIIAAKKAIEEHLARHEISAKIESTKIQASFYRLIYTLTESPLVSIIIPNKDHVPVLKNCLNSIVKKTTYHNYEIIIIENNSVENSTFDYYEELKEQSNIQIVYWGKKGFNYSELNNFGVQYAKGTHLIFLNNDIEIITPNWIEEMLMYSQRKDVGAVGIKLYFPDDTIQHAGVILGIGGIAGHIYYRVPRDTIGYLGKLHIVQNMSAVTAACMMVKKSVFEEIGVFAPLFHASFNDVDLCLRIRKAGYLVVWTPYAEAYHHESKTHWYPDTPEKQLVYDKEIDLFKSKWTEELAVGDPYYNCNFSLEWSDYRLKG
jgi:GT2 family glycosyltransferase